MFGLRPVNYRTILISDELYLLSDCLYPVDYIDFIIKSSKLESNVAIYSGSIHELDHKHFDEYSDNIKLEVLKNLYFRKLIGTNDTVSRNFVVIPEQNIVASVDDPVLLVETPFMFKTRITNIKVRRMFEQSDRTFTGEINEFIASCKCRISESNDEQINQNVKQFIVKMCDELEAVW